VKALKIHLGIQIPHSWYEVFIVYFQISYQVCMKKYGTMGTSCIVCPFRFSKYSWYPNQSPLDWTKHSPRFYGDPIYDTHLAAQHVSLLEDYISDMNVVHEDVGMRMFASLCGRCTRLVQIITQRGDIIFGRFYSSIPQALGSYL
jgi:hypothetical protein